MKNIEDVKKMLCKIDVEKLIDYKNNVLIPEFDHAKSFYKKAYIKSFSVHIEKYYNVKLLYSYNTLVLAMVASSDGIKYILNDDINDSLLFSNTTLRHIKETLLQNIKIIRLSSLIDGKITKKDIIKYNNKIL